MSINIEGDLNARLISAVKKEVKQVMEESVTRKFVHEESGSVTALCGAVESCLSQGLRRRALGLFKTSSTTALLHKIAKHNHEAAVISKKVQEIENVDPNRRSSSSSDSVTKPTLKKNASFHGLTPMPKYLWIRLALFEKQLAKIIDYLVSNANRYYEKDSLVADPDYGSILSSLLVGPCALDYSKTKTPDHFWTDPPADELVQRHRISSAHSTPPSVRRPILNFRRSLNTSSEDCITTRTSTQHYAKDYVESLHQNSRATLLFGKNNVLVLPANADATEPMPGYLSLHQSANGLTIKWTPNQLMNGFTDEVADKSVFWDYALQVRLDEIVYVHCHQESGSESGGTIIFVGQDGVQRPPIHFPKGGHMLAFLSCVETGLLPRGRLDPPLWSQRSNPPGKRRRPLATLGENEEENTKDLVFRIIDSGHHKEIGLKTNQLMDTHVQFPSKTRAQLASSSTSSEGSTKSLSLDQNVPDSPPSVCIKAVCDSMKRQIISRAFYGWLAYCRHLSTVRRHLSGLVNQKIISGDDAGDGLTFEKWLLLCVDGIVSDRAEVYRLTYFGGVAHDLRKEVWPYLLGHYKFGSTVDERRQLSEETRQAYENTMSEWLAVEAIVRQRDKETQATAIAKLSSESISGDQIPKEIQRDLSNDVFEDISDYDYESPDEKDKPSKKGLKTKQNTIKYDSDEDKEKKEEGVVEEVRVVDKVVVEEVVADEGVAEEEVVEEKVVDEEVVDEEVVKEVVEEEVGKEDVLEIEVVEEEVVEEEVVEEEVVEEEVVEEEVVGEEIVKEEVMKEEVMKEEVMKEEVMKEEVMKEEVMKEEVMKEEVMKEEVMKEEVMKEEVMKEEVVKEEVMKEEVMNEEVLKVDVVEDDAVEETPEGVKNSLTQEDLCVHNSRYTRSDSKSSRKHHQTSGISKEDSTSSTRAQFSSMDTEYSSRETETSDVCTEVEGDDLPSQDPTNNNAESMDFTPTCQMEDYVHNVIVTNASVDIPSCMADSTPNKNNLDAVKEENSLDTLDCMESHGLASPAVSACVSPASSNGGVYTQELLETFGLNLHRIEKDVQRCDRNYWYFTTENLEKLRNVMCTYVWEHLDIGYMQGMCDLVAPLLVIFNDESLTYACFCHLMERMVENFPNGTAMDCHFANMRSLIQILDSEIYELMQAHGDYTHFYFCYRWFLLDFKREMVYSDVYATWEVIWAAQQASSTHFVLFLALALLETYRDIILSNSMDFTDIIKFFNEMAERHNAASVLGLARDLVLQLQLLIENK